MERMKQDISSYSLRKLVAITLGALLVVTVGVYILFAFTSASPENFATAGAQLESTKHEELHRYLGYETLFPRYLTIPFDSCIGVNQFGHFLDIGYLFIIFIPIFIFYLLRRNTLFLSIFGLIFITYIVISIGNSIGVDSLTLNRLDNLKKLKRFIEAEPEKFIDEKAAQLVYQIMYFYNANLKPFFETISGEQDVITYPFIFILFLGLSLISYIYASRRGLMVGILALFTSSYCFFWLVLSSGVIWYGYILFVFIMMMLIYAMTQIRNHSLPSSRFLRSSFIGFASLWVLLGFICRVSNINLSDNYQNMGKAMFHSSVYKYNLGLLDDEDEVIEDLDKGQSIIFNKMNADRKTLVYKVGTSLMCFIKENNKRVFRDDQLNTFQQLREKYTSNKDLVNVLKASNFKFILLDLQTFSIDKTPGQTLVKKYDAFREFVARNPDLRFLGTDRVVKFKNEKGEEMLAKHIYGDPVFMGSYAAFEIL